MNALIAEGAAAEILIPVGGQSATLISSPDWQKVVAGRGSSPKTTIFGTEVADHLYLPEAVYWSVDTVFAGDGDDIVITRWTSLIDGGSGDDVLMGIKMRGGLGDDILIGAGAAQSNWYVLDGGEGRDIILGGGQMYGGDGDDVLVAQFDHAPCAQIWPRG